MSENSKVSNHKIEIHQNLEEYFFHSLQDLNQKSLIPVSGPYLIYTVKILCKLQQPDFYFEEHEGKLRDKILGIKLLESAQLDPLEQKKSLQDIGDTVICLCGYFKDTLKIEKRRKILDENYYLSIGKSAYSQLNNLTPQYLEVKNFFSNLAQYLTTITLLINHLAKSKNTQLEYLSAEDTDIRDKLVAGIIPTNYYSSKK